MQNTDLQNDTTNKMKVLVSGASIAGLTLAYWLRRHGFDVTVVELGAKPREGGAPIDVRGQALDVADRMGILPKIRAAKINTEGVAFVNATGKTLASMNPAMFDENPGDIELRRDDLVNMLYDTAKDDVEYLFENTIKTLVQDDSGVDVTFARGEARRFDFVVGADGLHSVVRRLAFGDEARFVHHLGMYVALVEISLELGGRENWVMFYSSPRKMAGITRYHNQAYAMFVFQSPKLSYDYRNLDQKKQLLIEAFGKESSWEVPKLLEAAKAAADFYFDSVSQVRENQSE